MNLKNLNVVELNNQELTTTEGGIWWLLAEIAYELAFAQDDVKKGYAAGQALIKNR
ncbi:hypothetical protein [Chryseobacterium aquaticum]|uniref:hypothetical protein n=1 Tax=Chryseobacterium aquaticum TaxID=452084 RepID=UPI000AF1B50A|nr:hypothetical protein [Chryseobacterium aquaticum]